MKKIGIFGSTGYAGLQLISILNYHEKVKIEFITSNKYSGSRLSEVYRHFNTDLDNKLLSTEESMKKINDIDLVFLALPHTVSMKIIKKIIKLNKNVKIIDLSGDFRFNDLELYEKNYNTKHVLKNHLKKFTYGLCEINKEKIKTSQYVANPGCYPTSAILPLYPLIKENLINKNNIIVDSKSGLSGAGRTANVNYIYTESNDNVYAYNTNIHRHQPEISENLYYANILFSPHIVPSTRGIFSTIYCELNKGVNKETLNKTLNKYYKDSYFIRLRKSAIQTKDVLRTNYCDISFSIDEKNNRLILFSTIDNLMKGAASQAIQNMNLMFNFKENQSINKNLFYI